MPRCEAASISITSSEVPFEIATQAWQVLSGVGVGPVRAVDRLGEDARERRLAGAARAGEEVGLPHLVRLDRVRERPHDRLLPDDLAEGLRAVLAVEGGHEAIQADRSAVGASASKHRAELRSKIHENSLFAFMS